MIWSTGDGSVRHWVRQPRGAIRKLEASPCGRRMLTADLYEVFVWVTASGLLEAELRVQMGWHAQLALTWGGEVMVGSFKGKLWAFRCGWMPEREWSSQDAFTVAAGAS